MRDRTENRKEASYTKGVSDAGRSGVANKEKVNGQEAGGRTMNRRQRMNPTKPISPSRMKLKFGRFYVVFFSAKGITGIIPRSYRSDRAARIRMTEEAILLCGCDEHPNLAIAMTQFNVVSTPKLKIIETSK